MEHFVQDRYEHGDAGERVRIISSRTGLGYSSIERSRRDLNEARTVGGVLAL